MFRSVLKKNRAEKKDGCTGIGGGAIFKRIVRKDFIEEVIF